MVTGAVRNRWWSRAKQQRVAVLAAGLLILAVGLCAFHGAPDNSHGHSHGITPDLCASVSMILAIPLLLARPAMNGWVVSIPSRFIYAVSADLLDRPPETFSFS